MPARNLSSEFGQEFRLQSEQMTDSVLCDRRLALEQVFLTADRHAYFRYCEVWAPDLAQRWPSPDWLASTLSPDPPSITPWAAVSRSAVTPKARVNGPRLYPFRRTWWQREYEGFGRCS